MFRIIPQRAFVEPAASLASVRPADCGSRATIRVQGLLCSACAANVRRRLERLDGVSSAEVDLDRGQALVSYDPARATPDAFIAAVERAVIVRPVRRLLATLGKSRRLPAR